MTEQTAAAEAALKPKKKAGTKKAAPKSKPLAKKAAAKVAKPEAIADVVGYPLTSKFEFGKKGDQKLSVDVSPKRPGTASAKRWSKYGAGKTLGDVLAAGVSRADLRYDLEHGFIVVKA